MRAGKLRHRVSIESQSTEKDDFGQPRLTWTAVASSVPADINPKGGREKFLADGRFPESDSVIVMRWRSGITSKMRVTFGTRHYDIQDVQNTRELNHELVLICKEGVNDG